MHAAECVVRHRGCRGGAGHDEFSDRGEWAAALRYREGESTSTRGCHVGDDSLLASLLRVTATRELVVEVTLFAPVRLVPTGRQRAARTALARITEALIRTGVVEERDNRAGFPR